MDNLSDLGDNLQVQSFLGYYYSDNLLVHGFNPYKYANIMNIENPHYVYDKDGFMLSMICDKTKRAAIWQCKKYIIIHKFNLVPLIHYFNNLFKVHNK